jgi:hypothetical protein
MDTPGTDAWFAASYRGAATERHGARASAVVV